MNNFSAKNGFTLIEVLIAAVILFMTIAATTMVYRSALLSSRNAEKVLLINGYVPFLVDLIEHQVIELDQGTQTHLQGEGEFAQLHYRWNSQLKDSRPPMTTLDPLTGQEVTQPARYRLWDVELLIEYQTKNTQFMFTVLSYPELAVN